MTIDWYTLLSQAGYPVAYNHFPPTSDTYAPPDPPFVVWLFPHEQHSGPDGMNMLSSDSVRVELYTSNKNAEAEIKIETILSPWPFTKDETWIPDQKMYLISYDLSILRRI
ncbi:hypothetical protein [Ethanoligenens sp.]|uniref:hypothetical protein n=1 Tax=Ethanoligenens sp. TaxID=2099655 RepID=UPI0039EB9EB8